MFKCKNRIKDYTQETPTLTKYEIINLKVEIILVSSPKDLGYLLKREQLSSRINGGHALV